MKKLILSLAIFFFALYSGLSQIGTDTISGDLEMAYYQLTNRFVYGTSMWIFGECRSDNSEVGGENTADMPDWQQAMLFNAESDDVTIKSTWIRFYNIIFCCNRVISEASNSSLTQEIKDRYIAEAKFLRALSYFNLAILFNSVPICTDVFDWPIVGQIIFQPSNPMNEVFEQVKMDLDAAAYFLPARSALGAGEEFRATSGAAKALLAKVYLYESSYAKNYPGDPRFEGMVQSWDHAADLADNVINSGEYSLTGGTFNTWWDNSYLYPGETPAFRYVFTVDGNNSSESLFAAKNLTIENGYTDYGGNEITAFTTCRYIKDESGQMTNSGGWGFNIPTQSLVDAFGEETGNPDDDPRFRVSIGEEEDSAYSEVPGTPGWYALDFEHFTFVDRACRKFECSPDEFWSIGNFWESPLDIPVIRYADVILIAAEAEFQLGNNAAALDLINMVRTRANASGSTGYPQTLSSLAFDDIVKERRLELALEGHRFFDLVRWNYADITLDGLYRETWGVNVIFEPGIDEFLPIPDGVVGTPSGIIQTENRENTRFYFYPNPVKDKITIVKNPEFTQIELYGLNGNIIFSENPESNAVSFDLSHLPGGVYFIRISNKETIRTRKFIKQ
jgi:hypothetical protein